MARTGIAHLPLHSGAAPRWLFERMTRLARQITLVLVEEFGPTDVLNRLSDPFWFQAFGCVLGFDWHSSGVTTTVCGALKEALRGLGADTGLYVAGGKGRTSRKTPQELVVWGDRLGLDAGPLVYSSRMAAKVDSAALQDGYQLYHHTFFFTGGGDWCVVQQGMNPDSRWARRYHWLSSGLEDFVCEPHQAVCCDERGVVLNMVAREGEQCRRISAAVAGERPERVAGELEKIARLDMPDRHHVLTADVDPRYLRKILLRTYEEQPEDFEALLGMEGVGAKTVRALALISDLVYGAKASVRDPVRYSFAHGGKDGHPYPVDRETYDRSIDTLHAAVSRAKLGERDKLDALRRLRSM
jgi:hypothetical protein